MRELSAVLAWLHIAALVAAVGGTTFFLLILRPVMLRTMEPPAAGKLIGAIQMRFRWVAWGAIAIFVITGLWMATAFRGMDGLDALLGTSFGRTLVLKSLLALVLFASVLALTLPYSWLAGFKKRGPAMQAFNIGLAIVIVLLSSLLVRAGGIF